ncbi:hypothetical protein ACA910_002830 [Epithemia clementina (nom. ined.)]
MVFERFRQRLRRKKQREIPTKIAVTRSQPRDLLEISTEGDASTEGTGMDLISYEADGDSAIVATPPVEEKPSVEVFVAGQCVVYNGKLNRTKNKNPPILIEHVCLEEEKEASVPTSISCYSAALECLALNSFH